MAMESRDGSQRKDTKSGRHVSVLTVPSFDRNKDTLLEVIKQHINIEEKTFCLEIASGTGQHVIHYAKNIPNSTWLPSDCDETCRGSIAGYVMMNPNLKNVLLPEYIDVSVPVEQWATKVPVNHQSCDIIVCVNMLHITTWDSVIGLFKAAGNILKPGAVLVTYGAYMIDGRLTPESNRRFDQALKRENPNYGVRDTKDLQKLAVENNINLENMIDAAANNKILIFRKNR